MPVFVRVPNISGVQPTVGVDGPRGRLGIIQIALHDLRPAGADFTLLIHAEFCTGPGVEHLHFGIWRGGAYRSQSHSFWIGRVAVRYRTGLGHAVTLTNAT